MVITMDIKHVTLRGETYIFRMRVPQDCTEEIGKKEIVVSLKTKDDSAVKASAARLEAFWTERFKEAREAKSPTTAKNTPTTPPDEDSEIFRQRLLDLKDKNLPEIFRTESDENLKHLLDFYEAGVIAVKENSPTLYDFPEIGIHWPFKPSKSPGFDRARKRILGEVLQLMYKAVAAELGLKPKSHIPTEKQTRQSLQPKIEKMVKTPDLLACRDS